MGWSLLYDADYFQIHFLSNLGLSPTAILNRRKERGKCAPSERSSISKTEEIARDGPELQLKLAKQARPQSTQPVERKQINGVRKWAFQGLGGPLFAGEVVKKSCSYLTTCVPSPANISEEEISRPPIRLNFNSVILSLILSPFFFFLKKKRMGISSSNHPRLATHALLGPLSFP